MSASEATRTTGTGEEITDLPSNEETDSTDEMALIEDTVQRASASKLMPIVVTGQSSKVTGDDLESSNLSYQDVTFSHVRGHC